MALQYPVFFKQNPSDPKNQTVVDSNGNPISLQQYKQLTGQSNVPDNQINWSFVKPGSYSQYAAEQSLLRYFTPDQIAGMSPDVKLSLGAFADSQEKQFELGKVNADINAGNFAQALAQATSDPAIAQKYGDELSIATKNLQTNLTNLADEYKQTDAANQRTFTQQDKDLADAEATAGRAYSGFRQQAKEKLAAEQGDIISSTTRNLKTAMQNIVSPFEQRYGSKALSTVTIPQIGPSQYDAYGNLIGTNDLEKKQDVQARAEQLYNNTYAQ